jgi:hypothetical protein
MRLSPLKFFNFFPSPSNAPSPEWAIQLAMGESPWDGKTRARQRAGNKGQREINGRTDGLY